MISCKLYKAIDVGELILIDNGMSQEVNMVHCLRQVNECPTIQADILRRLELIIKSQKSCELVIVNSTFSHSMGEFEFDQKLLDFLHLSLAVIKFVILFIRCQHTSCRGEVLSIPLSLLSFIVFLFYRICLHVHGSKIICFNYDQI